MLKCLKTAQWVRQSLDPGVGHPTCMCDAFGMRSALVSRVQRSRTQDLGSASYRASFLDSWSWYELTCSSVARSGSRALRARSVHKAQTRRYAANAGARRGTRTATRWHRHLLSRWRDLHKSHHCHQRNEWQTAKPKRPNQLSLCRSELTCDPMLWLRRRSVAAVGPLSQMSCREWRRVR